MSSNQNQYAEQIKGSLQEKVRTLDMIIQSRDEEIKALKEMVSDLKKYINQDTNCPPLFYGDER